MRWGKLTAVAGAAAVLAVAWADRQDTRRDLARLAARLDAEVSAPAGRQPDSSPPRVSPAPPASDRADTSPYTIDSPDILLLDPVLITPLPAYHVEPLDVLHATGKDVLAADPIDRPFPVAPDGTIDLGPAYGGEVRVAGLTAAESQRVLQTRVRQFAPRAELIVALSQCRGIQQIAGEHLVRPDGTIGLGTYGCVPVGGMTVARAKAAIEKHLSRYLDRPSVGVEVLGHNSKFYYVVFDGGRGEVVRLPLTGRETVLDGLVAAGGIRERGGPPRVWLSRSVAGGGEQTLPVRYEEIVQLGDATTNYQLRPGDRVVVACGD